MANDFKEYKEIYETANVIELYEAMVLRNALNWRATDGD